MLWFLNSMLNLIIKCHLLFLIEHTVAEFSFLFFTVIKNQFTQSMKSVVLEDPLVNFSIWESLKPLTALFAILPFASISALILPQ